MIVAAPELEHDEAVEPAGVVAATADVLVKATLHDVGTEVLRHRHRRAE